jgi:hypothetical protein
MARLITFRSQVAESLEQGDAMKFQEIFKRRLLESYHRRQKDIVRQIVEQDDPEMRMVSSIQAAAKSFGGHGFIYDQGMLGVLVPEGESADGFAAYLDDCDDVESYDENIIVLPVTSESPTDLEGGEGRTEVHFAIELSSENVFEFTGHQDLEESKRPTKKEEDDSEDDDESDDEEMQEKCVSKKKAVKEEDDSEDDFESSDDREDDSEEDDDMNESTHLGLMGKFNEFVSSVTPIENIKPLSEVSKIVTFRHVSTDSNDIKKQLKLPHRPGFKIVDGGYVRLTAQAKRNMAIGQISGVRKRAISQRRASKRREASLKKREMAGY